MRIVKTRRQILDAAFESIDAEYNQFVENENKKPARKNFSILLMIIVIFGVALIILAIAH